MPEAIDIEGLLGARPSEPELRQLEQEIPGILQLYQALTGAQQGSIQGYTSALGNANRQQLQQDQRWLMDLQGSQGNSLYRPQIETMQKQVENLTPAIARLQGVENRTAAQDARLAKWEDRLATVQPELTRLQGTNFNSSQQAAMPEVMAQLGNLRSLTGEMGTVDPNSATGRVLAMAGGTQPPSPQVQAQMIGDLPQLAAQSVQAQQIGALPQVSAREIGGLPQVSAQNVQAQQIGALPKVAAQNVGAGALGNDLLSVARDRLGRAGVLSAEELRGASQQALAGFAERGLGMSQAAASSEILNRESLSRQRFYEDAGFATGVQNADVARQVANQGANLSGQQSNLSAALNAAQSNQQAGLQAGQLNQNAGLQASMANADQARIAAMANQSANLSGQQSNLSAYLNAAQSNQQAGLQAGVANQGANLSAQQGNLSSYLTSQQSNQGAGLQAGIANQQAALQGQMQDRTFALEAAGLENNLAQQNWGRQAQLLGVEDNLNATNRAMGWSLPSQGLAAQGGALANSTTGGSLGYAGDINNTNFNALESRYNSWMNNSAALAGAQYQSQAGLEAARMQSMAMLGSAQLQAGASSDAARQAAGASLMGSGMTAGGAVAGAGLIAIGL